MLETWSPGDGFEGVEPFRGYTPRKAMAQCSLGTLPQKGLAQLCLWDPVSSCGRAVLKQGHPQVFASSSEAFPFPFLYHIVKTKGPSPEAEKMVLPNRRFSISKLFSL